ncbi:MAG: acylneuraminate cytidylyltransferase family protein [Phycisphaerales bacterium]|nr:acylneuraminate cytidylyltransferase family protein [Phycisphaerales bacterium]
MSTLALILGRAGSRGVPGKNTALIAGRPCVEWSIDAALASDAVDRVAISTDCTEMMTIARRRGLDVIARPEALASDHATVDDAARHALASLGPGDVDCICLLYANVPVRPADVIDRAVDVMRRTGADSVQSYQPVGKFHPWWMVRLEDDGVVHPWEGDVLNHGVFRRQDLPPALVPDGAVAVVSRTALCLEIPGVAPGPHAFLGRDRRGIVNPEGSVIDIDSPDDLLLARVMLERMESSCTSRHAASAPSSSPTSSPRSG